MPRMDRDLAYAICDDMDLPDGAFWAMVEEMSGAEPADFVLRGPGVGPYSKRKKPFNSPIYATTTERNRAKRQRRRARERNKARG